VDRGLGWCWRWWGLSPTAIGVLIGNGASGVGPRDHPAMLTRPAGCRRDGAYAGTMNGRNIKERDVSWTTAGNRPAPRLFSPEHAKTRNALIAANTKQSGIHRLHRSERHTRTIASKKLTVRLQVPAGTPVPEPGRHPRFSAMPVVVFGLGEPGPS
jgi:hypothetical protein